MEEEKEEIWSIRGAQPSFARSEDGGRQPQVKECGWPPEAGNSPWLAASEETVSPITCKALNPTNNVSEQRNGSSPRTSRKGEIRVRLLTSTLSLQDDSTEL